MSMRNLLKGGSLVVLLLSGLVQVLCVKADTKGTIRLSGISEARYPLSRPGDKCYHPLSNHVIEGVLYLLLVPMGAFLQACWTRAMLGSVLMV